jgi:segregation and condensation protein B
MAKKNKNKNHENENLVAAEVTQEIEIADELVFSEDVSVDTALFLQEDAESEGFLPEVSEDAIVEEEDVLAEVELSAADLDLEGSELEGFESAQIDEVEFIEDEQAESIIESILFASDRPVSLASIREVFKGTNIKKERIRRILDNLAVEYAGGRRGISLEEITGGYQLRTKIDNMNFLKRTVKARPFKLSGPALETLSIVAYKQPVVKNEIDQIRGVESGHLLRALMEKGLCNFEGKAENLPGKPMQYGTTRRFLEIFGLRNIKELPTLSQIDELLPEGIGEEEETKPTLSMVTDSMSEHVTDVSYSQGEEELGKIENELSTITTSSDFFEQEKIRQKMKKEADKAQDIRDAMAVGEAVSTRDKNWLIKYEEALNAPAVVLTAEEQVTAEIENTETSEISEIKEANAEKNEFIVSSEEGLAAQAVADFDEDTESDSDELPFYDEADSEPESHA